MCTKCRTRCHPLKDFPDVVHTHTTHIDCTTALHLAEETFVEHLGYEQPPVEVENLQHHQHGVEEVVAKERLEALHRIHPRTVYEPGGHEEALIGLTYTSIIEWLTNPNVHWKQLVTFKRKKCTT